MSAVYILKVATALVMVVRGFSSDAFQAIFPERYRWKSWSIYYQLILVFLLSFGGALVTELTKDPSIASAAVKALLAALAAVGLHKSTSDIGREQTRNAVKENPLYEPGSIRTIISPLIPIDKAILQKKGI